MCAELANRPGAAPAGTRIRQESMRRMARQDSGHAILRGQDVARDGDGVVSEYQCYEFVALDCPLSPKQIAELRAISTRAEISPTRFWNECQWGALSADPAKLMGRYFDAHLYVANWGTHRLMLRIPEQRKFKAARAGQGLRKLTQRPFRAQLRGVPEPR
jgi:hypothetical protein